MKLKTLTLIIFCGLSFASSIANARKSPVRHQVRGYFRKDGTYVQGYTAGSRTSSEGDDEPIQPNETPEPPDTNVYDSKGNIVPKVRIEKPFSGICSEVYDGDIIAVLRDGENTPFIIHLFGIAAPQDGQHFFEKSTAHLSSLALNKYLTVYPKGYRRDGNLTAWVFNGKICANSEQIRSGLAWHYADEAPKETKLAQLEQAARRKNAGLWCEKNFSTPPVAPWDWQP